MRHLYGVRVGTRWGLTRNKRKAIAFAREHKGEVRSMPEPDCSHWDMPTFWACSDPVVSFREPDNAEERAYLWVRAWLAVLSQPGTPWERGVRATQRYHAAKERAYATLNL